MQPDELQERALVNTMLLELRKLTNMQLVNMGLCVALEQDPILRDWYPNMSAFFTEQKGTKMHSVTENIFYKLQVILLEGGDAATK